MEFTFSSGRGNRFGTCRPRFGNYWLSNLNLCFFLLMFGLFLFLATLRHGLSVWFYFVMLWLFFVDLSRLRSLTVFE